MRTSEDWNLKRLAGAACAAAVCVFTAMPVLTQSSGVSHPPTTPIVDTDDLPAPATPPAKPSAAVPMKSGPAAGSVIPSSSGETYGAYVPYTGANSGPAAASAQTSAGPAFDPDANIVTAATAGRDERHAISAADPNDPDAGIVTHVVSPPGAVAEGTLLKARLRETLSTETTQAGTNFSGVVSEPMTRDGKVIVPAGSVLEGRVTYVRTGTRFNGGAAIHLEPRSITLPDGTAYVVRARVIDTGDWDKTKVDDEGTIEHRNSMKKAAAAIGLTAGGGAAAGAMIGGPAGAAIGAGVGAGAATVVWLKQDTQAELPRELELVFSLTEPMGVTPLGASNHAAAQEKGANSGGE